MKYIVTLPSALEPYCWKTGISSNKKWYVWGDRSTKLIRLYCEDPYPWGKEWLLLIKTAKNKSCNSEYAGMLDFKLYPPDQALSEGIPRYKFFRERYKSKFPIHVGKTDFIATFPAEDDMTGSSLIWISYFLTLK